MIVLALLLLFFASPSPSLESQQHAPCPLFSISLLPIREGINVSAGEDGNREQVQARGQREREQREREREQEARSAAAAGDGSLDRKREREKSPRPSFPRYACSGVSSPPLAFNAITLTVAVVPDRRHVGLSFLGGKKQKRREEGRKKGESCE